MRSIDEILSRIETLEDLPVSEEMLGAYFESNLSDEESAMVRGVIDSDLFLMNLEQEVKVTIAESVNFDDCAYDDIECFVPIELPEVSIVSEMEDSISDNGDALLSDAEIEYTDWAAIMDDMGENTHDNIEEQLEIEDIE